MEVAGIVFHQVVLMFCMIGIGLFLTKKKMVTEAAARNFSSILLKVVCPCLLINAYRQPKTAERTQGLLFAFGLAIVFHLLAIGISRFLIRKDEQNRYRLERMGAVYSNCGFMAFPILDALFGQDGIFYATAFVGVFNVVLWTDGIKTLMPETKLNLKKCILNPGCVSVIIGMITYFLEISYPSFLGETIEYMASMNTPLSMLITGIFLAQVSVPETLKSGRVWRSMATRVLIAPGVFLLLEALLGVKNWFPIAGMASIVTTICASCPSAASIILLPASFGKDEEGRQGAQIMAFTTLVSIGTLPLMTFLAYHLL
ncbi:MAG: AEC family transporter [Candidatus Limivivens sp.]|nr:AEC family transporter [Candidatus Limivivens sp.]